MGRVRHRRRCRRPSPFVANGSIPFAGWANALAVVGGLSPSSVSTQCGVCVDVACERRVVGLFRGVAVCRPSSPPPLSLLFLTPQPPLGICAEKDVVGETLARENGQLQRLLILEELSVRACFHSAFFPSSDTPPLRRRPTTPPLPNVTLDLFACQIVQGNVVYSRHFE